MPNACCESANWLRTLALPVSPTAGGLPVRDGFLNSVSPLLWNRRECLDALRMALGTLLPLHAHAKISRMLDRLDLRRVQITASEQEHDAMPENEAPDRGRMIQ